MRPFHERFNIIFSGIDKWIKITENAYRQRQKLMLQTKEQAFLQRQKKMIQTNEKAFQQRQKMIQTKEQTWRQRQKILIKAKEDIVKFSKQRQKALIGLLNKCLINTDFRQYQIQNRLRDANFVNQYQIQRILMAIAINSNNIAKIQNIIKSAYQSSNLVQSISKLMEQMKQNKIAVQVYEQIILKFDKYPIQIQKQIDICQIRNVTKWSQVCNNNKRMIQILKAISETAKKIQPFQTKISFYLIQSYQNKANYADWNSILARPVQNLLLQYQNFINKYNGQVKLTKNLCIKIMNILKSSASIQEEQYKSLSNELEKQSNNAYILLFIERRINDLQNILSIYEQFIGCIRYKQFAKNKIQKQCKYNKLSLPIKEELKLYIRAISQLQNKNINKTKQILSTNVYLYPLQIWTIMINCIKLCKAIILQKDKQNKQSHHEQYQNYASIFDRILEKIINLKGSDSQLQLYLNDEKISKNPAQIPVSQSIVQNIFKKQNIDSLQKQLLQNIDNINQQIRLKQFQIKKNKKISQQFYQLTIKISNLQDQIGGSKTQYQNIVKQIQSLQKQKIQQNQQKKTQINLEQIKDNLIEKQSTIIYLQQQKRQAQKAAANLKKIIQTANAKISNIQPYKLWYEKKLQQLKKSKLQIQDQLQNINNLSKQCHQLKVRQEQIFGIRQQQKRIQILQIQNLKIENNKYVEKIANQLSRIQKLQHNKQSLLLEFTQIKRNNFKIQFENGELNNILSEMYLKAKAANNQITELKHQIYLMNEKNKLLVNQRDEVKEFMIEIERISKQSLTLYHQNLLNKVKQNNELLLKMQNIQTQFYGLQVSFQESLSDLLGQYEVTKRQMKGLKRQLSELLDFCITNTEEEHYKKQKNQDMKQIISSTLIIQGLVGNFQRAVTISNELKYNEQITQFLQEMQQNIANLNKKCVKIKKIGYNSCRYQIIDKLKLLCKSQNVMPFSQISIIEHKEDASTNSFIGFLGQQ